MESERESHSVVLILCDPMAYTVHGILQARILEWVAFPFSRGSSQPRDRTQVSCTAGRFLPAELQRKPNNTGIGSPSLLQQIFPTRESNRDLPHCGQILYHLSHKGSPGLIRILLLSRFSRVQLCATPWTAAYQAPPSMGFSRQEYWSGVPLPSLY